MVKKNEVKKYQKRVGHTSGRMIEALPKPNVVRIQVLDGPARRSYMGGFQSILDEFRTTMQDACADASKYNIYEPFYGILDVSNAAGPSINVTANWSEPSNKTGFSMMNTLLTGDGSGGVIGLVPCVGGKLANSTSTALQAVDKLATSSMAFAGMNNNSTGSTTIKHFTSTKIGANMPLKFKWYLPEQEQMCRISIKRLIMMTYVRPMDMDSATIINAAINGIMNAGGKALDAAKDAMKEIGNFAMDTASDSCGNIPGSFLKLFSFFCQGNDDYSVISLASFSDHISRLLHFLKKRRKCSVVQHQAVTYLSDGDPVMLPQYQKYYVLSVGQSKRFQMRCIQICDLAGCSIKRKTELIIQFHGLMVIM